MIIKNLDGMSMDKIKFIADIGSNHNQDLNRIRKLIEDAKKVGCWAVKFQLFKADKLYAPGHIPEGLKENELDPDWIRNIKNICNDIDIKFGCTPFDLEAVDIIKPYVDFIKISSFDILRLDLIKKCAQTKLPIHLSTGLANFLELQKAYDIIEKYVHDIVIYYCVSKYPAQTKDIIINKLRHINWVNIIDLYKNNLIIKGYSDHSNSITVICSAIALGVKYIEIHLDLEDKKGNEYKHGHCWVPNQLQQAIESSNVINQLLNNRENQEEIEALRLQRADIDGLRPMRKARKT